MSLLAVQGGATGTGTVTLLAPITNTDRTLTLPDATGTVALQGGAGVGKVLQVVSATYATPTTISSTSFTDTGLSLSITPLSASSKILVIVSQPIIIARVANALNVDYQLLRGASSIFNGGRVSGLFVAGASEIDATSVLNAVYLDSPATTSATTYKTQARTSTTANSAAALFQTNSAVSSITLMEIAA